MIGKRQTTHISGRGVTMKTPFSDASLTLEYRDYLRSLIDLIVVAFMGTLGVLMLSFIVRWLFTGGVR